jgi:hypothetical protein
MTGYSYLINHIIHYGTCTNQIIFHERKVELYDMSCTFFSKIIIFNFKVVIIRFRLYQLFL